MAMPTSPDTKPALILISKSQVWFHHDMHVTPSGTGKANPPNPMKPAMKVK